MVSSTEKRWFKSHLSKRKKFCQVGGVDSEIKYVKVVVPQGSCLGPLLFLVFLNGLPCSVKSSTVSRCVDDTNLSCKSNLPAQLNEAMNNDPMRLESRMKENKISQNVAKTHSMLICSKTSKHRALISSNGKLDISAKDYISL